MADPQARFIGDEAQCDHGMIEHQLERCAGRGKLDQHLHRTVDEGDALPGRQPRAIDNMASQAFRRTDWRGQ
ncbi:hypothetical protein D3C80_2004240 [compost metagenome]